MLLLFQHSWPVLLLLFHLSNNFLSFDQMEHFDMLNDGMNGKREGMSWGLAL